ncbi:MAG TPA: adenylate/guanylate cyclase domain-containing protein [Chitinophagales bacterium]|nr:adenylate/guanylate cyclase domain-containing protein [Chitinophagales bacterium]
MKGTRAIRLRQWFTIIISTTLVGLLMSFYDYFLVHTPIVEKLAPVFVFWEYVVFSGLFGLLSGALIGAFMVYYIQDRFSEKSYGYTVLTLLALVLGAVFILSFFGVLFYASRLTGKPVTHPDSIKMFKELFFHRVNPIFLIIIPLVALQQLLLQISSKFGPGVLWKIIRGTYNGSKTENRIFMFVDLNDSTTLAERLSDERYHEFLKNFFADITTSILDHSGEIYQYLGDGLIIAWTYYGNEKDLHCVQCFFNMKKEIEERQEKYKNKFGIVPEFKGGIHCGKVVVGEIGIIKRDISYSGDVMNTTSRIQGMCKELGSELLISSELLRSFPPASNYQTKSAGRIHLKGKERDVELHSLQLS